MNHENKKSTRLIDLTVNALVDLAIGIILILIQKAIN